MPQVTIEKAIDGFEHESLTKEQLHNKIDSMFDEIPKEYREQATLYITTYKEYGGEYISFKIRYERPETEAEKLNRHASVQRAKEIKEGRERDLYERLKAKYERGE